MFSKEILAAFFDTYVELWKSERDSLPMAGFDKEWPSPCTREVLGEKASWLPVERQPKGSLAGVGDGFDTIIHPDLDTYFSSYFSDNIKAHFQDKLLELLFAWSEDDFTRLQENLIGHGVAKQRARQDLTFFFALIDDDRFLSIENQSGRVVLEVLGSRKTTVIAESMTDLFAELRPALNAT